MDYVLWLGLGVLVALIGIWTICAAIQTESSLLGGVLAVASVVLLVVAILLPIWGLGGFDGPSDPCQYLISAKPVVYGHHEGWISYGGRPVWCGPGPVPR